MPLLWILKVSSVLQKSQNLEGLLGVIVLPHFIEEARLHFENGAESFALRAEP